MQRIIVDNIIYIIHKDKKTEFYKWQMQKSLIIIKITLRKTNMVSGPGSRVSFVKQGPTPKTQR